MVRNVGYNPNTVHSLYRQNMKNMNCSVDGKIPTIHIKYKYKNKRVHINGLHLNSMVCVSYYLPEKVRRGEHKIHEVNLKTDLLTETCLVCVLYYLLSVREIVEPRDQRMTMYMKKKNPQNTWLELSEPSLQFIWKSKQLQLWRKIVFCYLTKARRISLELKPTQWNDSY